MKTSGGMPERDDGQTELFSGSPEKPDDTEKMRPEEKRGSIRGEKISREKVAADDAEKEEALAVLFAHCAPVKAGSREAAWLKSHRIFRKTWLAQELRVVADYRSVSNGLVSRFARDARIAWGLFNREDHLRFYRHTLLVPWFENGRIRHVQAFSTESDANPAMLASVSPAPCPYNADRLDGVPGRLYLCASSLHALELLEADFPAVAADENGMLAPDWLSRFSGKSVYVTYGSDAGSEAAATRAITQLTRAGVEAHRLKPTTLPFT